MRYNAVIENLNVPTRFKRLPIDRRGYPVPRFVCWIDGEPDFRVIDASWMRKCITQNLCWLCGDPLGRYKAFVIGPMCAINRVNSEPPSHLECARFAVRACPFMANPHRRRNEQDMPEESVTTVGVPIARNPGSCCIWVTDRYRPFRARDDLQPGLPSGIMFHLGEPSRLEWYCCGHTASRSEIIASIEAGLLILRQLASDEGAEAEAQLERQVQRGMKLVPAE